MSKTAVNPKYLKVNDADKDYQYNKKIIASLILKTNTLLRSSMFYSILN